MTLRPKAVLGTKGKPDYTPPVCGCKKCPSKQCPAFIEQFSTETERRRVDGDKIPDGIVTSHRCVNCGHEWGHIILERKENRADA